MTTPEEILDYWLGELTPQDWYAGSAALDAEIRTRFLPDWQAAQTGACEDWVDGAAGALAYILLTDQFPRNMFRGEARAFATDPQAIVAANLAIAAGWDLDAPEPERQFFYLPFMHSEDPRHQAYCLELFGERMPQTGAENLLHARAHQEVIRRFGRFPYRNAALGRDTTPDEAAFLDDGGYATLVAQLRG